MKEDLKFNTDKQKLIEEFSKKFNFKMKFILFGVILIVSITLNFIFTQKATWLYDSFATEEAKQFTLECKNMGMDQEIDLSSIDINSEGLYSFKFCKDKSVYIKNIDVTIYYRSVCDAVSFGRGMRRGTCNPIDITENGTKYQNTDSSPYRFRFKSNFLSGDMVTTTARKNY